MNSILSSALFYVQFQVKKEQTKINFTWSLIQNQFKKTNKLKTILFKK